jgi:hypothetical protein
MLPTKFQFIWLRGFRGEDLNVRTYDERRRTTDAKLSLPFFLIFMLSPIKPNMAGMVLAWVPFKSVSDRSTLHSRWLLLLKIEFFSIVHYCFIINLNELSYMEMSSLTYIPGDSGFSFSKFPAGRHFVLKLFYDELRTFSTFFALNFDKKLAGNR